jgi:hypothetical protein
MCVLPERTDRRCYLACMRRPLARAMAVSCVVIALVALGSVAPVQAADGGPGRYQQAQVGLTYTVYAPTFTAGLKRTSFALEGCGSGRDEFINANYGSQGPTLTTWIGMNQSTSGCIDGPDGVGPAATFTVKGAQVTVMGNCRRCLGLQDRDPTVCAEGRLHDRHPAVRGRRPVHHVRRGLHAAADGQADPAFLNGLHTVQ